MKKLKISIISMFIAITLMLSACDKIDLSAITNKIKKFETSKIVTEVDFLEQPATDWRSYRETRDIKAIYMTGNTIGWKKRFNELVDFMNKTEINGVVIDIKDDYGELTYDSLLPMVKEVEADKTVKDKEFVETISLLEENDI